MRTPVLRDAASTGSAAPQDERHELPMPVRPEEGLSEAADRRSKARLEGPIIVLVRPQLGQNIGKAARAMLNFGLTEMRLVAPRDGWPNPDAGPAASGADIVLEQAQVFATVAEAIADCTPGLRLDGSPPRPRHAGGRARGDGAQSSRAAGPHRDPVRARAIGPRNRRRRACQRHRHRSDQSRIRQPQPRPGGDPARLRMVARGRARAAAGQGRSRRPRPMARSRG